MTEKTCPSLSGRSTLKYEIENQDGEISIRILENSTGGIFSRGWIPLILVKHALASAEAPFSSGALKGLFGGKSINNAGFTLAILKHEGIIESASGKGYTLSLAPEVKNSIENFKVAG